MWVNKDDVFVEDKIREFKITNPNSEVHLRQAHVVSTLHSPISLPHSLHYSLIHSPSMSSDADSILPYKYPTGAYGDSPLGVRSDTAADIANTFHNMSIHTPARLSPDGATTQAEEVFYALLFPNDAVVRDADCFSLALKANLGSTSEARPTQPQLNQQGMIPVQSL
jgi:hypothetical protein